MRRRPVNREESEVDTADTEYNEETEETKQIEENEENTGQTHHNSHSHSHSHHHTHGHHRPRARVYKRWLVVTSLFTFIIAWLIFPLFFDLNRHFSQFSRVSELLFEKELFRGTGGGLGEGAEQLRAKLMAFLRQSTDSEGSHSPTGKDTRSPGRQMRRLGAHAHFPIVMIPGVTSTGLELWEGRKCARGLFRQRLWGTLTMLRTLLMDKQCWIEHLRVDPRTGGDPPGIRVRAAQGLEAADFLLPGFWVWAHVISNLAEIGYDHNNLHMAAYDWRLDLENLQSRDHYFSRLKSSIELLKRGNKGRRVVIVAHSLGSNVWIYFQKWVEAEIKVGGGGGGPTWISDHIEAFVNLAGPLLGAPKSISTILSGETRDTARMGTLETYLLESLLSKHERLSLFRSWMGGFAIFPKGGNRIWGSSTMGSGDAAPGLKGYDLLTINSGEHTTAITTDDVPVIQDRALPEDIVHRYRRLYSDGIATPNQVAKNDQKPRTWVNPLEARLPRAPTTKIYCLYGVGHDTERAYVYKPFPGKEGDRNTLNPKELALPLVLDVQAERREHGLYTGVYHTDGDATVPLLSLSYMCSHGWRNFSHLNPAQMKIVTREYKHQPSTKVTDIRGGPASSDHVDILGNHQLLTDILKIASNYGDNGPIEDRIYSDILGIAERINLKF